MNKFFYDKISFGRFKFNDKARMYYIDGGNITYVNNLYPETYRLYFLKFYRMKK